MQKHWYDPEKALNVVNSPLRVWTLNKPDISFSRSNMALVASSCSQLTWLFRHWESSPLGKVPWSFPLALFTPPDSLKPIFSFLFDLALKWSHDGPSALSPCKPPFWLQCGVKSESGGSSSPVVFVEARDSCDLDRVSPLKIILKWEVKGLSESSVLSWEQFSFVDCGSFSVSVSSGGSGGELQWEITIVGIVASGTSLPFPVEAAGFSKGRAVDSGFKDGVMISFGASVWGLELCKGKQSGCDSWPWVAFLIESGTHQQLHEAIYICWGRHFKRAAPPTLHTKCNLLVTRSTNESEMSFYGLTMVTVMPAQILFFSCIFVLFLW